MTLKCRPTTGVYLHNYHVNVCQQNDLEFDTELVRKVLTKFKHGKAADMFGLSAEHLIFSHPALSVVLARLFSLILLSGYVPRGFKISYTVSIPKTKEFMSKSLSYDDFRGIVISPIISKVFEYCFFGTELGPYFLRRIVG